ncbi:MAG: nucleoside-diphosphate kinase [Acidiferrobacteraceae bacterium]|jgi:nucleoside-diphosphate kinase|nr:nucleoside-diphosphate kinase [Acidiferrobacteraceae bacterium]|tara:strand:+ start:14871 stop:15305 length:435 start_codon:yes stop_codon:yes gene_type:complete
MNAEKTLSIVKPDAVEKNVIGTILARFENSGLNVVAAKMIWLSTRDAKKFYEVHKTKPFYSELVDYMASGPLLVQVLEGVNAINKNREIMGATNPDDASPGTIRADFAESIQANAVHGSDSPETAAQEISFFFSGSEIYSRNKK